MSRVRLQPLVVQAPVCAGIDALTVDRSAPNGVAPTVSTDPVQPRRLGTSEPRSPLIDTSSSRC